MKVISGAIYSLFAIFGFTQCDPVHLTTKEVPLYIRQSWTAVIDPIRTYCITESGVDPKLAYNSIMDSKIPNNANLKRFCKCVGVELNLIDATTGVLNEQEHLRQVEGITSEIFKKCDDQLKNVVDLDEKCFGMFLCCVHSVAKPKSSPYRESPSGYHH